MSSVSSFQYETVYILKPGVSEPDAASISQRMDDVIKKFDGSVTLRDDWGITDLAYPIEEEKAGRFQVVIYTGKGGVVEEIERHFKISENIIRFITVMVDSEYDYNRLKKQFQQVEEDGKKDRFKRRSEREY